LYISVRNNTNAADLCRGVNCPKFEILKNVSGGLGPIVPLVGSGQSPGQGFRGPEAPGSSCILAYLKQRNHFS